MIMLRRGDSNQDSCNQIGMFLMDEFSNNIWGVFGLILIQMGGGICMNYQTEEETKFGENKKGGEEREEEKEEEEDKEKEDTGKEEEMIHSVEE
jgi:hypothetical protein